MNLQLLHRFPLFLVFICHMTFMSCDKQTLPQEPDTIPPIATIIYPVDGMTISGIVQVRISASDNDKVDIIEYFLNEELQGTENTSPFIFTWNTLEFADDESYYLSAKVVDRSDNFYQTEPITIVINNYDNDGPAGEILYPAPSLTVSGTIDILAYPTDADAVFAQFLIDDSLRFTDNTLNIVQPWNVNVFSYEWDTYDVTDNETHSITVVLADTAGNTTALSSWIFVNNQVDLIPPIGNITSPAAGQTVQGTIVIQVTATDNDEILLVQCFIDGDSLNTDFSEPYQFNWNTWEYTEDTEHMIYVTIEDLSGNVASAPPITVFVNNEEDEDITPPTGIIVNPSAGQIIQGTIQIEVSAYDNIEISHVEFSIDGETVSADYSFPYYYLWNTEEVEDDQEYILGATVYDTTGNWAPVQPITILVDNQDNVFPEGTIMSPYAGQVVQGVVNIDILATDNVAVQYVEIYIDGDLVKTDNSIPYGYTWNTTDAEEDTGHSITVIIEDKNGNRTTLPPISVTVNNLPDTDTTPPIISIMNPVSGQTIGGIVDILINSTDNEYVDHVSIYIDGVHISTITDNPYTYQWDTNALENNSQHTINAEATDGYNNTSPAQPVLVTIYND
ncbi:MAG: hypothetical protein ISS10_01640 [Candidatus Marinimicrobia bacterium]|nr:hypothetical protein [Candidatus Neomarinimicrobiota bacterium]